MTCCSAAPTRRRFDEGLLFTNLVDFDMVWGHRNDVDGFAAGLAAVDAALPGIIAALDPGDMLLITADHGVDPTTVSTDHSREYVPLLLYPRPAGLPGGRLRGHPRRHRRDGVRVAHREAHPAWAETC